MNRALLDGKGANYQRQGMFSENKLYPNPRYLFFLKRRQIINTKGKQNE